MRTKARKLLGEPDAPWLAPRRLNRPPPPLEAPGELTPLGPEALVNTATAGARKGASAAALEGGGHVIVWTAPDAGGDGVFARIFDAGGDPLGAEFGVNLDTAGGQTSAAVAPLEGGGFIVTWNSPSGALARIFAADGAPQAGDIEIDAGADFNPLFASPAALPGGGFVLGWHEGGNGGQVQRYDESGNAVGDRLTVTGSNFSLAVSDDRILVVHAALDGSGFGVFARLYGLDGAPDGGAIAVNSFTTNSQASPSVAALAGGGFVVTWTSSSQDGSEGGIYGQVLAADGAPAGSEFRVNVVTAGNQVNSSVTALPGGGFVVGWTSASQDAGGSGVYARAFAADGAALGGEFRINETSAGAQALGDHARALAALDDDTMLFAWNGNGAGDADGIFARSFTIDLNRAPIAGDDTAGVAEDDWVEIAVLANDGDPDGDTLVIASAGPATHGEVSITPEGTIRYTPHADYFGADSFTYTVADANGATALATVSVTVAAVNETPVAGDDAATATEDEAVVIDILANDGDADGGALAVAALGAAAHGTVTLNPDQTVTYAPDADYVGSDSFEYTLSDGEGGTDIATVTITVEPFPGVAINGTAGHDSLIGGAGDDTISGKAGADTLVGLANADRLNGGDGRDSIAGGTGDDTLEGRKSNDRIADEAGANLLLGGEGRDSIEGGAGADTIDGGTHADLIWGGAGDDMLRGGPGGDTLAGGAGADLLVFKLGDPAVPDTIADFVSGEDLIDLSRVDADPAAPGRQRFVFTGATDTGAAGSLFALDQGDGGFLVGGHRDGDGVADFTLIVIAPAAPVASDFIGVT